MSNRYAEIAGNRYEDEQQRLELRPAWRSFWQWYLLIFIILYLTEESEIWNVGLMLSVILGAIVVVLRYRYLFIITSKRVISRIGLIARNTSEIEIRHTREFSVKQGIIERILNYGNIGISSAASWGTEVMFTGIISPHDLKEAIRTVRNGGQ